MSVRDTLEQSHIDSFYTSVRTKKKPKNKALSAFNAQAEWQSLAFGSYSGGGPPQDVMEQHLESLKDEELLALEKNTLMDRKSKIVSPYATDFVPSPFTSNGSALLKFEKHKRNNNVESALNNFFIEQNKLRKQRKKELKKLKKEMEKNQNQTKEGNDDLVYAISPIDEDFNQIVSKNQEIIPNLQLNNLNKTKSNSNSNLKSAASFRSTTSSISGIDDDSLDEEENTSARGRVNTDANKVIKKHGQRFLDNLSKTIIKLSTSLNKRFFFKTLKVSLFSDFVDSCYKLKVRKVEMLIKGGFGSGSTMTEEDETIFYSMFNRTIQYDQSVDQEPNLFKKGKDQIVTLKMLQETPNFTIERKKMQKILQLLLENYGDINEFSPRNIYAPIHLAISSNNSYLSTWLIKKKCNINLLCKDCDDEEFFSHGRVNRAMKESKDPDGVQRLRPGLGLTPLMIAAKYGYVHLLALLVKSGVEINLASNELNMIHPNYCPIKLDALQSSAQVKNNDNNAIIKENEEDAAKRKKGLTALHIAAMYGQTRAALFLLRVGANRQIQDQWGRTPSEVAFER